MPSAYGLVLGCSGCGRPTLNLLAKSLRQVMGTSNVNVWFVSADQVLASTLIRSKRQCAHFVLPQLLPDFRICAASSPRSKQRAWRALHACAFMSWPNACCRRSVSLRELPARIHMPDMNSLASANAVCAVACKPPSCGGRRTTVIHLPDLREHQLQSCDKVQQVLGVVVQRRRSDPYDVRLQRRASASVALMRRASQVNACGTPAWTHWLSPRACRR